MALAFLFKPASLSATQYDECIRRLSAAGAGAPAGRLHHACFGTGDKMQVLELWDSPASFDKFGATLVPILAELGIDPGQPEVAEVHNVIPG